jgi:rSAM/selenodomain-associated transferase 1
MRHDASAAGRHGSAEPRAPGAESIARERGQPAAPRAAVAVMAKLPGLEPVKSRLHRAVTPEMATLLHRCFLLDRLDQLAALPDIVPALAFSPGWAGARAAALAPEGYRLVPQPAGDLGDRMSGVLAALLGQGHSSALVLGSDSPTLPMAVVAEAARHLRGDAADVVLGPAADGGYYLIGLRRAAPALFRRIPWSTDHVMALTLERVRQLGLRAHVLATWFDVDTEADLARLRDDLRAGDPVPPRTGRCLRAIYG